MTEAARAGTTLLSICIPTFNRERSLENLFRNLAQVKKEHGDRVEVCISDNHSTDRTPDVIAAWRDTLDLTVQTHASNIGATRNVISLTSVCRGRWTLLIGDDDEIDHRGLAALLRHLERAGPDDWVLAGVAGSDGKEMLLGDLVGGVHTKAAFRWRLIRTGLHRYGFIGMHVFPASARAVFSGLTLENSQPWPHIAAMLRALDQGNVHVFRPAVVKQAAGGSLLFWNAADMAKITLSRLRILEKATEAVPAHRWFHRFMIARELYSVQSLMLLLSWRIYEAESFKREALPAYVKGYRLAGPLAPCMLPHMAFAAVLHVTPDRIFRGLLALIGREHFIARYRDRKSKSKDHDGISRGI